MKKRGMRRWKMAQWDDERVMQHYVRLFRHFERRLGMKKRLRNAAVDPNISAVNGISVGAEVRTNSAGKRSTIPLVYIAKEAFQKW